MEKKGKDSFQRLEIKTETDARADVRVMKIDADAQPVVQQFNFGKLHRAGEGSYSATKQKFGSLAVTDSERTDRRQKDRRFSMNPLLKDPLSIEEEERRVIEEKVRVRIDAVTEEAKKRGHEQGYKEGLEQGRTESFQRFQSDMIDRILSFEELLKEAEACKMAVFRANERFLMEIVFRMVKAVTLKELAADREYILRLTTELLQRCGARENIRIRIHPMDAETIQKLKPGIEASLGALQNITFEISDEVKQGGCMVDTEWNSINADLETQFQGVHDALMGKEMGKDR